MRKYLLFSILIFSGVVSFGKEYHVSKNGNDSNEGTIKSPLLTIQAAAEIAKPGDIITVHEGVYREWIRPVRGGESDSKRIVFRAAEGKRVEIKGSELIKGWEKLAGSVWKVSIPNSFFGDFNPYKELIMGDWFNDHGRLHHRGEVYLNGKSLWESSTLHGVLNPEIQSDKYDSEGSVYTWFCEYDSENTYIYANFHAADPNKELVEINVRESCFYPESTGINYITVRGFRMSQAATQWAPPTAEQLGLIGTNWSKGWIIEDNIISDSKCSGITLGKYGDEWDNTSANSAEGYVKTIERALQNGWNKDKIGHHIVRNNIIFNCEQTGICGSLGAIFSVIENNDIYNIWAKRQFSGAEMGGIKIHASVDMLIKNNRLTNCGRGLWLDWMAQGTRVIGNLMYNNTTDDLFVEVNHGPFLIENNLLLSEVSIRDWSQGGAYVHNLVAGDIVIKPQTRDTPFLLPHSTQVKGLSKTLCGDNRFYNNIFVGDPENENAMRGMRSYRNTEYPVFANGNVYLNKAAPHNDEANKLVIDNDPSIYIEENGEVVYLMISMDKRILRMRNVSVNTELLGKAIVSDQGYVNPDGTKLTVDLDYFRISRNLNNPVPGPFEDPGTGELKIKVWPM